MCSEYHPLPETETAEPAPDCPEGTALLTVGEFYDLLMEQQEQM